MRLFGQLVENGSWTGNGFTVELPAFDQRLADLGWLRAAYLVAFAAFGYRYAFSKALAPIRLQLDHPEAELLTSFRTVQADADSTRKNLVWVHEPEWLRSFLIEFGRNRVILPLPDDPDLYERLARRPPGGTQTPFRGQQLTWPEAPLHMLDFGK